MSPKARSAVSSSNAEAERSSRTGRIVWVLVYVVIYIQQKLYLTAALYALFVILCAKGYLDWRRAVVAVA